MDGLVLQDGDLFLFTGSDGGVDPLAGHGFYRHDTRHLSGYDFALLTQAVGVGGAPAVRLERARVVEGALYERFTLRNESAVEVHLSCRLWVAADFADLFEVRGFARSRRGSMLPPSVGAGPGGAAVRLEYDGVDGLARWTAVSIQSADSRFTATAVPQPPDGAVFQLVVRVGPGQSVHWDVVVKAGDATAAGRDDQPGGGFQAAAERAELGLRRWRDATRVPWDEGGHRWAPLLEQALRDLRLLRTDWGWGPIITAGTPWYAVPFGRDSLITALQLLPFRDDVARGTLRTLAALQGQQVDPWRDEAPGKILHEARRGEMASSGQVPFGRYFGSVDSTLLFLMLMGETWRRTGDVELCRELLPVAEAALRWAKDYGDRDGDGYLEYHREGPAGLVNQGWKDSADAVSHRTGELAESPIALCEVQGYFYEALLGMGEVLAALGDTGRAHTLRSQAEALKEDFNQDFWLEEEGTVALGLDREKQPIRVVTSNSGHCLWTGILTDDHGAAVARRLLAPDLFSGWGLRTLSSRERRYDPLSYHNGSVWPHDTAIAAAGLVRYGQREEAARLAEALLDAAAAFPQGRLPELFSGEERRPGVLPGHYPNACSPQAWAAGSLLMLWSVLHR
ncbi:MAG: amylo-alpha-1,6-glucosidase [Symbiobacteriia bacterium]